MIILSPLFFLLSSLIVRHRFYTHRKLFSSIKMTEIKTKIVEDLIKNYSKELTEFELKVYRHCAKIPEGIFLRSVE